MATAVLPVPVESPQDSNEESSEESEPETSRPSHMRSTVSVVNRPEERKRRRTPSPLVGPTPDEQWVEKTEQEPVTKKKKDDDSILTKTGGAYIPPARLRMMQEAITDKTSVAYQRMAWEALKKSINGLINKVNVANIADIVRELFQENIVRGRGLLARSVISAQSASPTFTHVYACLVAIINTKFPQTGELISKRLIIQFQKAFRRNDKKICLSSVRFIAHLVNQQVVHELLALELLTVLLENPTSDSVEVAVGFLKECGVKLTELSPRGIQGVFDSLKSILHDGDVDVRVQYMIEVMFAIRKDQFKDYPAIPEGLDLIQEDDQITHLISLDDELEGEDMINVFRADPEFQENEDRYRAIKEEILGEGSSDDESDDGEVEDSDEEGEGEGEQEDGEMKIIDETQTDLLSLRRTIYLTIMSSLDFEECAHKLLKMELRPGQELEVANMIIECCSQERSYQRFYGLLGERFCHLEEKWVEKFDAAFQEQYTTVHRLETNKLRNISKFFAQLFYTDALPWTSLSCIHLNEEETNSSSRIFIKILFQELAEYMGLQKLNQRLKDPTLSAFFEGLMPRDNPKNTRFSINFFTSIGLGGLTDDLREHLKTAPKMIMAQDQDISSGSSSSEDSSSSSDSEESSESSSEESSSSDESDRVKKKRASSKKGAVTKTSHHDSKRKKEGERGRDKREQDTREQKKKDYRDLERNGKEDNRKQNENGDKRSSRNTRERNDKQKKSRSPPSHRKRSPETSPPPRRKRSPEISSRRKQSPEMSPPRRKRSPEMSPHRKRSPETSPPPRRKRSPEMSPPPRRKRSPEMSSHRKRSPEMSPPRRKQSPEMSPPRRKRSPEKSPRKKRSPEMSPPRRKRSPEMSARRKQSPERSPPRRKRSPERSPLRRKRSPEMSPPRRKRSPEMSPPPRRKHIPESSPPRRRRSPERSHRRRHTPERSRRDSSDSQ